MKKNTVRQTNKFEIFIISETGFAADHDFSKEKDKEKKKVIDNDNPQKIYQ